MSRDEPISLSSGDEIEQSRAKRRRLDAPIESESSASAAFPLQVNLYMNSLANEGTRGEVNRGCLALRDILNENICIPDKVRLSLSHNICV